MFDPVSNQLFSQACTPRAQLFANAACSDCKKFSQPIKLDFFFHFRNCRKSGSISIQCTRSSDFFQQQKCVKTVCLKWVAPSAPVRLPMHQVFDPSLFLQGKNYSVLPPNIVGHIALTSIWCHEGPRGIAYRAQPLTEATLHADHPSHIWEVIWMPLTLAAPKSAGDWVKPKVKNQFGKLARVWRHSTLHPQQKIRIFQACVVSKLLYCLHTMWLNKAELRKIDGFQCLRSILYIPPPYISRISNATVLQKNDWQPLSAILKFRQLSLFQSHGVPRDEREGNGIKITEGTNIQIYSETSSAGTSWAEKWPD